MSSANTITQEPTVCDQTSRVWFVSAPVDLFLCCGGLLWLFVALHAIAVPTTHQFAVLRSGPISGEQALALALMVSAYLFTYPHAMATWRRLYKNQTSVRKYWQCSIVAPLLIAGLFCLTIADQRAIPWFVLVSALVNMFHWVAQCYGVALIYFARAKFPLAKAEKRAIWISCQTLSLVAALRVLAFPQKQQVLTFGLSMPDVVFIPPAYCQAFEWAAYALWGITAAWLSLRWIKARVMPPVAVLALAFTIFRVSLNSLDSCVNLLVYGLPLFHSVQYLMIASRFYANETKTFPVNQAVKPLNYFFNPTMARYWLTLLISGWLLYTICPVLLQKAGVPILEATAVFYMLLNFHHIFSDSFIWRLKDPSVRANV